ncbi:class I SAM-dependent methyltransferase [Streptomyces sp. ODS28]|uniref:class I SAM-dependent methyltransferase n=1 Tax=Streptomyces sp. ODS28 TaxID=3136688 RepID=UPI0031E9F350
MSEPAGDGRSRDGGSTDPYRSSAEYIDLLLESQWRTLGPLVCAEFGKLTARAGAALDIGAGTGRGLRAVCAALPGVPVTAVEPSAAMRTALFARVADDPTLRRHVTVVPGDALSVPFPRPLRALLALNVVGHLPPAERRELWSRIADALAPGGAALVGAPRPEHPAVLERERGGGAVVGERAYEGWAGAEPAGSGRIVWHMTYEVKDVRDGALLHRVAVDYDWWVVPEAELREEWAAAGLTARHASGGPGPVHVLTRADG